MIAKVFRFIVKSPLLRWIRKPARRIFRKSKLAIISYEYDDSAKIFKQIDLIKNEVHLNLNDAEANQLCMAVSAVKHIDGDIAEVGVYQGGSAKLICESKENKKLHLFDTFEGVPDQCITVKDSTKVKGGIFSGEFEKVRKYLSEYHGIFFHVGVFPKTTKNIEETLFSFVHLDVDTYKTTLDALEYFYPKMNIGGVLISHDYMTLEGVRKAFDDFFKDKSEPVIKLAGSQCLIVKISERTGENK